MGFTHSVELATAFAIVILKRVAPQGAQCLHIGQDDVFPISPIELYFDSYIDNVFLFTADLQLARRTHLKFNGELVKKRVGAVRV